MKLDHFVVNIDEKYQKNKECISNIRKMGFPYEPKWGKGTGGFKVSNLWIGNEYLEMVHIRNKDGGGWLSEWTAKYNQGHRGLICIMLDVDNIDSVYQSLRERDIDMTSPEWLEFKWFFHMFTRRMPWRNCYAPFFENVPFQIGFQEMKDDVSRDFMKQYMVPNAREVGINGIYRVVVNGPYTTGDFDIIFKIFDKKAYAEQNRIRVVLNEVQSIEFVKEKSYHIELYTDSNTENFIEIENIKLFGP